jgi:hypothetical protein
MVGSRSKSDIRRASENLVKLVQSTRRETSSAHNLRPPRKAAFARWITISFYPEQLNPSNERQF